MKRTNGKVPEEKFKEWGFADKAGIAYVELQSRVLRSKIPSAGFASANPER